MREVLVAIVLVAIAVFALAAAVVWFWNGLTYNTKLKMLRTELDDAIDRVHRLADSGVVYPEPICWHVFSSQAAAQDFMAPLPMSRIVSFRKITCEGIDEIVTAYIVLTTPREI